MKKIIIFLILILFYQKTFALELDTFDNLRLFLYSPQMLYNKWVDLYKSWDYKKADFYFDMTKCWKDKEICSKKFYNKWNTEYKLWEQSKDINEKQVNWESSANSYNESLKYKFDDYTKQNLDFVLQKLNALKQKKDEEKKQQEEQKKKENSKKDNNSSQKEEQKQDSKTSSGSTQKEEQKKQEEKSQKQEQKWQKWEDSPQVVKNQSMWLGWDANNKQALSPDEAKQLEDYYQSLKNDEKQNQEFFNKKNNDKKEESPFDQFLSPFKFFDSDPFFDEQWQKDNWKDW